MKDWKFIKIGNEATGPNWDKKRQLEDELRGWMTTAQKLTGEEKANAEKQIAEIRKELNDVKIKIAHGENKKVWNAKDKNKKDIKIGDVVDVLGKKGKITKIIGDVVEVFFDNTGTNYPDRSDRFYSNEVVKVGNSKAGNETLAEYAKSKPRIINGLIRARNAIKTKNADITLWNGNDSAYIKEDGHVQYLENNSFVVDEDKYDSQEKAVEELTKKGYRKK